MSIIDNNDTNSHYQQNTNHINLSTFTEQPLSSVFDNNSTGSNMNNNMNMNMRLNMNVNNGMNNGMNNMNSIDMTNCGRTTLGNSQDRNKILLKHIRWKKHQGLPRSRRQLLV